MAVCTDPCCCCGEPYDDVNPEYTLCYGCLKYHNIKSNICQLCENDKTPLYASRFWDNLHATEQSDLYIFCSESCRAQFNFRYIMYPRVFSVGKLSLSLKRLKERNYERNYWVNTLMPIISVVLLVTLISIQFGTTFTKRGSYYLLIYSQLWL